MTSVDFIEALTQHWDKKLEPKHLWAHLGQFGGEEPPRRRSGRTAPSLAEGDLQRVDEAFARAAEACGRSLAIVLSEEPAEQEASAFYVHYEPAADHVFALSTSERRACLCTHYKRWEALRSEFLAVQARIDHHLQEARFIDALLACVDEVHTVSRLLRWRPWLPG
ncbi:MAG: hypothetical protein KDK70_10745 [Myxococcales bacterium]|nr:hypothetical protein [Myxococcales bacterium]